MSVEGRTAIVTGVTTGVGRGIAADLAGRGVKVVGTGRREELGRALENEVRASGGALDFVRADVSVVDDCRRVVESTVERHGRVDMLVNNAGTVGEPAMVPSHQVTEDWWDIIIDTNLKGAFFCTRYALEPMMERGSGSVVNIASINGVNYGPARMAAYTASKAGMIALTKTLATEYVGHGIRFNVVVLGRTVGDSGEASMNQFRLERMGDAYEPERLKNIPGLFTGEELGAVVAFLCSDDASFINGAAIAVDGGLSAGLPTASLPEPLSVELHDRIGAGPRAGVTESP